MATYIDLTHTLSLSRTPHTIYPGDPGLSITPHATILQDGYNVHALKLGTHTGTHIDAPAHFIEGGMSIDEVPLNRLIGKALVVDFTVAGIKLAARRKIEWEDLEDAWLRQLSSACTESLDDKMNSGDYSMLLVNTGWSKSRCSSSEFFDHPYFSSSLARRLLSSKVHLFGCDTSNPDETPYNGIGGSDNFIFHQLVLGGGGLIVENLANLDQLGRDDWVVTIAPLKIEGADGSPVRAFAYRKGGEQ